MTIKRMIRRVGLVLIGVCAAWLLGGCASYEKRWQAATLQAVPDDDIAGPWVGTWDCEATQHHGELRAVVEKTGSDSYIAHYHATWGRFFTHRYSAPFTTQRRDGLYHFGGEHDLGWPWGTHRYTGHATPTEFFANYSAKNNRGTYRMTRPESAPHPPATASQ